MHTPLTVAGDGIIWAVGWAKNEDGPRLVVADNVVRRFDSSGKMLASFVAHGRTRNADPDATAASYLMASRDRVGWLTNGCEYIEFSLDGTELGRFDGPAGLKIGQIEGAALSDENDLVVGKFGGGGFDILALDRRARAWVSVTLPKETIRGWSSVLGFDGTTLVATPRSGQLRRFNRGDPSVR